MSQHRRQTSAGRDCEMGLLESNDATVATGVAGTGTAGLTADPVTKAECPKHANVSPKVSAHQGPVLVAGLGMVNSSVIAQSNAWNVSTVRGKVTDRCLWSVCKALTLGVFLIATGAGMATLGYYSDRLSTVSERRGNETIMVKNEKRDSHLNILTYLGPVVMGVGGFIIVAACVMTFEARDTAAKIVPVWFRKTRPRVVPSSSNASVVSSRTSWERFLVRRSMPPVPSSATATTAANRGSQIKSQDKRTASYQQQRDFRNSINDSLINFGKFLQSSMESGKLSPAAPGGDRATDKRLRKCPSESDIHRSLTLGKRSPSIRGNEGEAEELLKAEATPETPNNHNNKNLLAPPSFQFRCGSPAPHRPSLGGQRLFRQAVSVDGPSAAEYASQGHQPEVGKETVGNQTKYDSNTSMAMELYLPQGSFTLKVKDEQRVIPGGALVQLVSASGGHHGLAVRSGSNASSASGAKCTPPGSRRHTPQSSFDRTLKSLSRDSSRSSGGAGYRTPQQSISRNNSGTRSPHTHTPPSPLSRHNSGAGNEPAVGRRHTCIPHSPNWLPEVKSRFDYPSTPAGQDQQDSDQRVRTDSVGSGDGSRPRHKHSHRRATEAGLTSVDSEEPSAASKRHPFVRQRALENKTES